MRTPPQLPDDRVRELLSGLIPQYPCAILAVRGYFEKTMGDPGRNDVGLYDDAAFFLHPGGIIRTRWNTDPTRIGYSPSVGKNIAMLQPGDWFFIRGAHKGRYPALRQADEDQAEAAGIPDFGHFKVWRAKIMEQIIAGTATTDVGYFAINCHNGGNGTTSSLGCQTEPNDTYPGFLGPVCEITKAHGMKRIPYRLINGPVA